MNKNKNYFDQIERGREFDPDPPVAIRGDKSGAGSRDRPRPKKWKRNEWTVRRGRQAGNE